jgi:hypothetical protein
MLELQDSDPVFYIKKNDFRRKIRQCSFKDWVSTIHEEAEEYILSDEEYEQVVLVFRELGEYQRFTVHM